MEKGALIAGGLVLAIIIGVAAVFLASPDPDGLESTALIVQGDKTLTGNTPPGAEVQEDAEGRFVYRSPMKDYTLGDAIGKPGEILAIIVGIVVVFIVVFGAVTLIRRRSPRTNRN